MNYPARPERLFVALIGILELTGLVCITVGWIMDRQVFVSVGWWMGVIGIAFAALTLVLLFVVLIVETLRSH
jgi:hypothetical protein